MNRQTLGEFWRHNPRTNKHFENLLMPFDRELNLLKNKLKED